MEGLNTNLVFKAMARPPMMLGVELNFFCAIALIIVAGFMELRSFWVIALGVVLYLLGLIQSKFDLYFFSVLEKKVLFTGRVANFSFWGVQSYEPY